ncbi:hypothetical protein P3W55_32045 [Pseudomonas citronellolis]|uniref:Uncharacterized protein n=1 Tax=Pseudomonas citronellolis TaxID=53408 RepID=A0AAW6PFR9_9PSED|nr:hypothetical protein [Pseudomonas citronellolis]MDF3846353.1 hypothetical protein [Pseudomonas citronellolis]
MSSPSISLCKLALGIAAGIWLGFVAVVLSCVLLLRLWPGAPLPLAGLSPAPASAPAPTPDANAAMFQQYLENQRKAQAEQSRQLEQSEREQRFNSAPCQFWRQQYQADPSEKNRLKMDGYCG